MRKFIGTISDIACRTLCQAGCMLLCLMCLGGLVSGWVDGIPLKAGLSAALFFAGSLWVSTALMVLVEWFVFSRLLKRAVVVGFEPFLKTVHKHTQIIARANVLLLPSLLAILSERSFLIEYTAEQGLLLSMQIMTYVTAFLFTHGITKSLLFLYRQRASSVNEPVASRA